MAGILNAACLPDVKWIKEHAEEVTTGKLGEIDGVKDVVLDTELMAPLDRILGASVLKKQKVDKIFKLEKPVGPIRCCNQRVYIVKNNPQTMRMIAGQIIIDRQAGVIVKYKILMVPRKLYICEKVLEEEGVYGYLSVDDLPINLVVIDRDILSLESKSFFRSYYLDKDQTCLHEAAQSLNDIQNIYGNFNNIFCIGQCAQKVDHLSKLLARKLETSATNSTTTTTTTSSSSSFSNINSDHFTHLLLVDREVDYITPLCSQVTYEGLLDDTLDVNCGYVQLGPEVTNLQKSTKVLLSSQDVILNEIRDRHFSSVSTFLSAKAKDLQQGYEKRRNLDISGTKDFIQKDLKNLLTQHNSLSIHVAACEYISKKKTKGEIDLLLRVEHSLLEGVDLKECITYLEELINRQVDMSRCLNLLCLLSLTEGGISSTTYKSLVMQFLQSYGYSHLSSLHNLKRLGLLQELTNQYLASNLLNKVVNIASNHGSYRAVARKLNLVPKSPEFINLKNPNDMSYVFSGAYSPLLCRVIEQVLIQDSYAGLEDLFKLLNVSISSGKTAKSARTLPPLPSSLPLKVILVYFLGGCTYSEISALRFLAKQRGYTITVATTSIISSQNFLRPVM